MKNKLLYLMVGLVLLFSCEENEDGYYDNIPRIYFPEEIRLETRWLNIPVTL